MCDISALKGVKDSLRALRIENCAKIKDFSVLEELENLELLELTGSNVLPSLDFMKGMKSLKTLILKMNVLDGDLSRCLDLSYVYAKIHRHLRTKICQVVNTIAETIILKNTDALSNK